MSDQGLDVEKEVTGMKRVEDRGGTQTATKVLLLFLFLFSTQWIVFQCKLFSILGIFN